MKSSHSTICQEWMISVRIAMNTKNIFSRALFLLFLAFPTIVLAAGEYSFDLEEFEKKSFDIVGYVEMKFDHLNINQGGIASLLNLYQEPHSSLDRFGMASQLGGNFNKGIVDLNWLVQAGAQQDQVAWNDSADVFEAYVSVNSSPSFTIDFGKKVFKWGKGYAWNPVGVIDRPKDPDNPEEALEGFIGAGVDWIKSFSGPIQTTAVTAVVLPVWQDINKDFGESGNINIAGKFYLLYRDTDLDFIIFSGNSRSTRYGFDFSKNLATNFEIHAEVLHVPSQNVKKLTASGAMITDVLADTSYLIGARYLSESDITTIIEYYHNDDGYRNAEMEAYFKFAENAGIQLINTGSDVLLSKAQQVSQLGYGRPQAGRNYLYTKITKKEPLGLLYFTPGLTSIINLDDKSYSFSPEAVYTGFTNWELRIKGTIANGGYFTEYGEKLSEERLEFRVRYHF